MPTYTYRARGPEGRLTCGVIDALDEITAALAVERLGLSPISITPQRGGIFSLTALFDKRMRRVSHTDLLLFTRQLSTLIITGVPLIQSLENVRDETQNLRFKEILDNITGSLREGLSFSESIGRYPDIFSNLYVSLVRVGETGGLLDKVLSRLADISTQEIEIRSRLRSALVYPVVLAAIAFLIVNFVLIGVLPKFVAIFEASSARLPLPTRVLLSLSYVLRNFWWAFAVGFAALLNYFFRYYRSQRGRYRIDGLILRAPLFGPLVLKIIVSRFSRSTAALVKSGIPILNALSVVEDTIPNVVMQGIIRDIRSAISEGHSLTEPFKASGLFPPMVIQLINTGERTGKLNEMFDQIAIFYEPEVESILRNLTSLLEPAMLLVMGAVVSFIALSVLLPIFNLISIIRR